MPTIAPSFCETHAVFVQMDWRVIFYVLETGGSSAREVRAGRGPEGVAFVGRVGLQGLTPVCLGGGAGNGIDYVAAGEPKEAAGKVACPLFYPPAARRGRRGMAGFYRIGR